jgi:hypothetical protein
MKKLTVITFWLVATISFGASIYYQTRAEIPTTNNLIEGFGHCILGCIFTIGATIYDEVIKK